MVHLYIDYSLQLSHLHHKYSYNHYKLVFLNVPLRSPLPTYSNNPASLKQSLTANVSRMTLPVYSNERGSKNPCFKAVKVTVKSAF